MVLRALLSWVRLAFAAVPESSILSSTILNDCFQAVSCSDVSDVSVYSHNLPNCTNLFNRLLATLYQRL